MMNSFEYSKPDEVIKDFPFNEIILGEINGAYGPTYARIRNFPDINRDRTPVFIPEFTNNETEMVNEKIVAAGGTVERINLTKHEKEGIRFCATEGGLSILESVHLVKNRPDLLGSVQTGKGIDRSTVSVGGEPGSGKSMILSAIELLYDEGVLGGMDPFSRYPSELYSRFFSKTKLTKKSSPHEIYTAVRSVGKDPSVISMPNRPACLSAALDGLLDIKSKDLVFMEALSAPFQFGVPVLSNHLASLLGTEATISLHTGGQFLAGQWDKSLSQFSNGYLVEDGEGARPDTGIYWIPENSTSPGTYVGMNEKVLEYFIEDYPQIRKSLLDRSKVFKQKVVDLIV